MIDQLDASGLSVAAFAEAEGVPAPSLYHWRRRLRQRPEGPVHTTPPRWVRLEPATAAASLQDQARAGVATAELVGGDRVRVPVTHLPELIAALRVSGGGS